MYSITIFPFISDGLIVCHLPFGPTAYFTLCNVVMRHDIPDLGTMSEAYPHLILHNFTSRLGRRVSLALYAATYVAHASSNLLCSCPQASSILKHLFPVPKEESKRVITFANQEDYISFRYASSFGLPLTRLCPCSSNEALFVLPTGTMFTGRRIIAILSCRRLGPGLR